MNINNTSAVPVKEYSNIIPLTVINGKLSKKNEPKYKKDGSIKLTKNNKEKGKTSEVYGFTTREEIAAMVNVFDHHIKYANNNNQKQIACRNKLLFLIGMNIGIRGSDLRTLKWSFFFDNIDNRLKFKPYYVLQPKKQRKQNKFVKLYFNNTVKSAIREYISEYPIDSLDNYLFPSRKGDESITVSGLWQIIKDAAIEANINKNIGSHSLRKTFGFWCWHEAEDKSKALVTLQNIFNHSSTQTTAKYIGILDDEIEEMYNSIELGFN